MPQLVGKSCVICDRTIKSAHEAEFCASCGNPLHLKCLEGYQHRDTDEASSCARCGGNPAAAPVKSSGAAGSRPEYWLYGLAALVVLIAVAIVSSAISSLAPTADSRTQAPASDSQVPAGDSEQSLQDEGPVAESGNPIVEIETTLGTIRAELFQDKAPITARNFLDLVRQEFYDGIIFHRVIDEFMIQTGDPLGTGTGGRTDKGLPAKRLLDEFDPQLRHDKPGVLSMANSGPNTGDTQFFITTVPTAWLDDKHAIFGQVVEGMDVVHKIEKVRTDASDRPATEVQMVSVRVVGD